MFTSLWQALQLEDQSIWPGLGTGCVPVARDIAQLCPGRAGGQGWQGEETDIKGLGRRSRVTLGRAGLASRGVRPGCALRAPGPPGLSQSCPSGLSGWGGWGGCQQGGRVMNSSRDSAQRWLTAAVSTRLALRPALLPTQISLCPPSTVCLPEAPPCLWPQPTASSLAL